MPQSNVICHLSSSARSAASARSSSGPFQLIHKWLFAVRPRSRQRPMAVAPVCVPDQVKFNRQFGASAFCHFSHRHLCPRVRKPSPPVFKPREKNIFMPPRGRSRSVASNYAASLLAGHQHIESGTKHDRLQADLFMQRLTWSPQWRLQIVRSWHFADIDANSEHVRFWG